MVGSQCTSRAHLLVGLFLLLSGMSCSSALYYPSQQTYYPYERLGLQAEHVELKPTEDRKIYGDWLTPIPSTSKKEPQTQGIIIFFHGNGENRTSHFAALHWLPPEGYPVFIFDYAGYGESEGSPSPEGTVQDGIAALRWAATRANALHVPLIVYGQSLGGAVALRSLIELKRTLIPALIVLDSTFLEYSEAARSVLSQHWWTTWLGPLTRLLVSNQWAPGARISELSGVPFVIIHGDQDLIIHPELGAQLFAAAPEPKELWTVHGGRHIDAFWKHDGVYRKRFLEKLAALRP